VATVTGQSADDLLALLCRQWADVLGRPDAGPATDFFDAGGDSLTAMRLATRISRRTGQEVRVQDVFDCGTPASLADRLRDRVPEVGR
jgi:nonribosomal peptide synthetase DhbF